MSILPTVGNIVGKASGDPDKSKSGDMEGAVVKPSEVLDGTGVMAPMGPELFGDIGSLVGTTAEPSSVTTSCVGDSVGSIGSRLGS